MILGLIGAELRLKLARKKKEKLTHTKVSLLSIFGCSYTTRNNLFVLDALPVNKIK